MSKNFEQAPRDPLNFIDDPRVADLYEDLTRYGRGPDPDFTELKYETLYCRPMPRMSLGLPEGIESQLALRRPQNETLGLLAEIGIDAGLSYRRCAAEQAASDKRAYTATFEETVDPQKIIVAAIKGTSTPVHGVVEIHGKQIAVAAEERSEAENLDRDVAYASELNEALSSGLADLVAKAVPDPLRSNLKNRLYMWATGAVLFPAPVLAAHKLQQTEFGEGLSNMNLWQRALVGAAVGAPVAFYVRKVNHMLERMSTVHKKRPIAQEILKDVNRYPMVMPKSRLARRSYE